MTASDRIDTELEHLLDRVHVRRDRGFAVLMMLQWLLAIAFAVAWSPYAWSGKVATPSLHLGYALIGGGLLTLPTVGLAIWRPGWVVTRHTVATSQMLWSALLIHLTGGRIETHFHIFGSLAFLAFYRKWQVLLTAAAVVTGEHLLRGLMWPESVYGIANPEWWRLFEHVGWVVFECGVLTIGIRETLREMRERLNERAAELESRARIADELRDALVAVQAASRAKSAFLAQMSHELRTPLNVIIGYTEMLGEDITDAGQQDDIGRILGSGRHLLALIDQVLDLSRIESGRIPASTERFSLAPLLREVIDASDPLMKRNRNTLQVSIAPDLGELTGDPTQVRQIALNLLSNAAKFTSDGTVTLTVSRLPAPEGDTVVLEVKDTGIGMTPETVAKLFQPFVQADDVHLRFGGSGLGLALSARLAETMGGRIEVESRPGHGSTFRFVVPAAR